MSREARAEVVVLAEEALENGRRCRLPLPPMPISELRSDSVDGADVRFCAAAGGASTAAAAAGVGCAGLSAERGELEIKVEIRDLECDVLICTVQTLLKSRAKITPLIS